MTDRRYLYGKSAPALPGKAELDRARRLAELEADQSEWEARERFRAIEDANADARDRGGY
jgi:hypothetical protein